MKSKSLKDYIGTLPLTMEMFPEKQWTDDKGRQWTSNIKTSLEKNPKDNKWYLFPTMMGGLDLPFIGAYEGALKCKHFGVYDSKKEGMKADKDIHEYFDSIKGYQQGGAIEPDATKVHNNIDNLMLQAKLDEFDRTGVLRTQPESPRGVADALSRDFVEGLLPIGAGVKLFRGVPRWFRGKMVKGGRHVSPEEQSKGLEHITGAVKQPSKSGTWATDIKKEAEIYARSHGKGTGHVLEYDVPKKFYDDAITSWNDPKSPFFATPNWFDLGIPKEYLKKVHKGYQQGGTVEPDATKVHNNIDNLIIETELDKLAQTGSMRVDRTPEYIGGLDPIVENVALSPILTLKSLGSVGKKILEKTGLRNPISHYTSGSNAASILNRKKIVGTGEFPGRRVPGQSASAVSVTRDPMFTSRPHGSIGTDIRFILDRDELVKKGLPMEPIAVSNYKKTTPLYGGKTLGDVAEGKLYRTGSKMNPRFEFEERVRGSIPTENIKLIDILQLPLSESDQSHNVLRLLRSLYKTNIPIIKSSSVAERLRNMPMSSSDIDYWKGDYRKPRGVYRGIRKLLESPTYKFDPFEKVR